MTKRPFQPKAMCSELIRAMRTGEFSACSHLPPETELAQAMGVSRTQIRDVLAILEQEGFITRRHGIGTVINRHVLDVPVRMDIETEFLEMIENSGFASAVSHVSTGLRPADEEMARSLNIAPGESVFCITRLCTADGRPAIYCEDALPQSLIKTDCDSAELEKPFFHFLEHCCGVYPYMDLTDLSPVAADEELAKIFAVPVGSPLLKMREVDYDIAGRPLFYATQYFADGIFRHTVLRKKL